MANVKVDLNSTPKNISSTLTDDTEYTIQNVGLGDMYVAETDDRNNVPVAPSVNDSAGLIFGRYMWGSITPRAGSSIWAWSLDAGAVVIASA